MLPFTRRSFNWSAAALRCIVVSKRAFLKQWVEGWLTDRQGGRNNWIGMKGKAGPSTMSPLPSWQCQSSDEEEMSICSDFVTIMRCGCWIEQSHTYWNWTARYPFHSPSREFNHLHHHHHPHHHLLGWQCIEVSPHSWSHLRNGFIAGKQATASQCITLHHSAPHGTTLHHSEPQCITVHRTTKVLQRCARGIPMHSTTVCGMCRAMISTTVSVQFALMKNSGDSAAFAL